MSASSTKRPRAAGVWLLAGTLLLAAACASVDPAPFTQFAASLEPLRAGTDSQAGAAATSSRQDLIDRVGRGEVSPADLQLEFDGFATTYGFAESEPNFAKLRRFQRGLSTLNDTMIAYAHSLVVLSGGGKGGDIVPTTAQFDQMARDLNANAGSAAKALGVSIDSDTQALLSAAAVQLFKAYIESKRRQALSQAIAEVQPRVDEFSVSAQQAVRFLATLVETDYAKKALSLMTASPVDAAPILDLNDNTQATLATLESLWSAYGRLPGAHRDLSAAASKRATGLAGLAALGSEATRLQGLVTELRAANEAAAKPASR